MGQYLVYKGIVFDDYTQNEDGTYWAEVCEECAKKFHSLLDVELDEGGTACGCCSVNGCTNSGESDSVLHYYIDFKNEEVTFREG